MGIALTNAQKSTLEPNINLLVEAGAGSGKTTVFIQRFITLLHENPDLTVEHILGITYTKLAASELLLKLRTAILKDQHPALLNLEFKEKLLSQLHKVPFMTIHGLCAQLCKRFPKEANIDPEATICDPLQNSLMMDDAISETLSSHSAQKNNSLKALLLVYAPSQLTSLTKQLLVQRLVTTPHAIRYINTSIEDHLQTDDISPDTHRAYTRLHHLCQFFLDCTTHYDTLKQKNAMMDYDDLILKSLTILEHPHCLNQLQNLYRFIMVDEFQDTDHYQWTIIQRLCDTFSAFEKDKLFLVGDVKQSIYSFRHADPEIFMSVFNTFKSSPSYGKVIHMADNFRSNAAILTTVNTLFDALFQTSTLSIPYTPLRANHHHTSTVSLAQLDNYTSFKDEATFIATWIAHHLHTTKTSPSDIAILTRRKTPFPALKKALEHLNIPVTVDTQVNFFRRSHILDLIHSIELLVSPYSTLALFAILKSPLMGLSEEDLFLFQYHQSQHSDNTSSVLFDHYKVYPLPTEHSIKRDLLLNALITSKKLTMSHSIRHLLTTLSYTKHYSENEIKDMELFIDLVEEWEETFKHNRHDLLQHIFHSIDINAIPASRQTHIEGVRLLTIHASKGLEFPTVIVPELHQPFNLNKQSSLLITKKGLGLSCSDLETPNQYRTYLLKEHENAILDEEKRLFYVACTRAKTHLLLTGNADLKKQDSYLSFLKSAPLHDIPHLIHYSSVHDIAPAPHYTPPSKTDTLFDINEDQPPQEPNKTDINTPINRAKVSLSVSQIDAFLRCPKHYWFTPLFQAFNAKKHSKNSLDKGILTHALIDKINTSPTPVDTIIDTLLKTHQKEDDSELRHFLTTQATHYLSSSIFKATKTHTWLSEKSFSFSYEDMIIEGRFDFVLFEENTVHVIDFKTDYSYTKNTHKTQLLIYMLALSQLYPHYAVKASLYFTQHNHLSTLEWDDAEMTSFKTTLTDITTETHGHVSLKKSFTAPHSDMCAQCPLYEYDKTCPTKPL